MEEQLSNLLAKYVRSLKENINRRFDNALPVVSAFSIFDPLAVPNPGSPGFKDYGTNEVRSWLSTSIQVTLDNISFSWNGRNSCTTCQVGNLPFQMR